MATEWSERRGSTHNDVPLPHRSEMNLCSALSFCSASTSRKKHTSPGCGPAGLFKREDIPVTVIQKTDVGIVLSVKAANESINVGSTFRDSSYRREISVQS